MHKLQVGNVYHGFRLEEDTAVKEINSTAKIFKHEKSGARLLFLENEDDNKVFSITFRTPPTDSTGVPHIIEHSVLCGSRKFPVKEPFVELIKGSLNTFLNAMTFPDKTMYPVASRNDKDFRNLMDVYLDAVFFPNIHQSPEILMQEGWHYELENKQDELTYKGVVYNEMKGAYSSPDAVLETKAFEALFPDTTYGVDSGGDPEVIPNLTYEQFIEFHKKYYHPANGYIFLYGDMDIVDNLKFIDEEYLSKFDKIEVPSQIPMQKPFEKTVTREDVYPISPGEKTTGKTFISLNTVVGPSTDPELYLAFQILQHMLIETPAAPLKQALLNADIGKDVFGSFVEAIQQPVFTVGVTGAEPEQQEEFLKVVYRTLQQLVTMGIDKKLIESSVNFYEFQLREANFGSRPKGLIYNIRCMDSWLYDQSPLMHLAYEPALERIKAALTTNYFEKLIEQHLMDNTHRVLMVLKPDQGVAEQKTRELKQRLADYKAKLSDAELNEIIAQTHTLSERQQTEDTPENLAKIPLLALQDIDTKVETLPLEEKQEQNVPVLFHPLFTNQIAYVNLYFDTTTVPQDKLPYLYLLAEMLSKVSTEKYSYTDLANEINIHTGGFVFNSVAYAENQSDNAYRPKFRVQAKALVEKLPQMVALLSEVLGHSRFDDGKRVKELVQAVKAYWDTGIFANAQNVIVSRVLGYFSPVSRYNEQGFLSFFEFMADLEKHYAQKAEEIARNLAEVAKLIFNRDNLLISVTAEEQHYGEFQKALPSLLEGLGEKSGQRYQYQFEFGQRNEGLMTSAKVQYVAKGANFKRLGYEYQGSMKVLETILRYDYLWTRVRVQGGAYGGFARFERTGNMVFGSYRDPNLKETIRVYDEAGPYLSKFNVSEREMTKYIIGTISLLDMPMNPPMKGDRATEYYIRNISQSNLQRERDEVLASKQQDIQRLGELVDKAMKENYLCVLGNEAKIRDNDKEFANLVNVFD